MARCCSLARTSARVLPVSTQYGHWATTASRRYFPPALPIFSAATPARLARSEEHTSELQSRGHLVCRLLLEKKKKRRFINVRKTERSEERERRHAHTQ